MSDKQKEILKTVKEAIPNMSDFDKGYILGKSEQVIAEQKKAEKEKTTQDDDNAEG